MALTPVPGTTGYKAYRYSSADKRAMGKFTDQNHLYNLTRADGPTPYDRGIIDIWTQTSLESNDFIDMINKSEIFWVDGDDFSWEIAGRHEFPKVIEVPTTTANDPNVGQDGKPFELVFDTDYFQENDTISNNYIFGETYAVVSQPRPYGAGWIYSLVLVGEDVTPTSQPSQSALQVGVEFDKTNGVIGEFDQRLGGLPYFGDKIRLYNSLSAGYGVEHQVTKWADGVNLRDSKGNPLDIIVYDQYKVNQAGKSVYTGSRWEPFVERRMRDEMMKYRKHRMLYGSGGEMNTLGFRQESKKISTGIIPQIRKHGNRLEYNQGDFSINLIRDLFGDLFYRRVPFEQRRVKLYTNEAGIRLFQQANKDDLMNSGFTIVADNRFIQGTGTNMRVQYAFDSAYTMETGVIEVSHLMELDLPNLNSSYGQNKYSTPIFLAFDISNADGGLTNNIREIRRRGENGMTWGYIDGRLHHLGYENSKGMSSSSMFPGYQVWMEDRADLWIEDLSKTVIIEQVPQF